MNLSDATTIKRLHESMKLLITEDFHLIEHDLSEQSISHKLAEKLQWLFPKYNVDCEYNGNVFEDNGKKRITILKNELRNKKLLRENEEDLSHEICRSVFPDILVHVRKENKSNLLIIEMKKSSNSTSREYDTMKLKAYTNNYYGNQLEYQLGVLVEINTTNDKGNYEFELYKNGTTIANNR